MEPAALSPYEQEIQTWRAKRKQRLLAEDGWLSIVAKELLHEGENVVRVGDDIVARAWLAAGAVRVEPSPGADVLRFEPLQRGAQTYLRVRNAQSPARLSFEQIPHFPVQPKWRIVAKLEPNTPHKVIELDYEGGQSEKYESPGSAVFEIDGVRYSVDPVFDQGTPRLYLLFRDATFRDSTYGAGRFLYAPLPKDGEVVLDFNQAFNPPCALTPFASCPLTPAQNKLDLRIEAGEKRL